MREPEVAMMAGRARETSRQQPPRIALL